MKYALSILIALLFSFSTLMGQDNAALLPILEQIKEEIKDVEGKSNTYAQELSWNEEAPYKIKLTITTTSNKKGKSEEMTYQCNLRDIDRNTVKVKNDKDLMKVPLFMDNRQKLVKVFKEGKQEKYIDRIEIIGADIDNARKLATLYEEAVAIATKIKPEGLPETFEERMDWLTQNVVAIQIDETTYNQSIEQDTDLPVVVHYTLTKQGKKTEETTWHLNLADLKERTVQLKIKGKEVLVEMQTTRNQKFIQQDKEDKESTYVNKMAFYVDEPDKGKMLADALKGIIPQCQAMEKERFPVIADLQTGLDLLVEKVGNLDIKDKSYTQSIEGACITTINFSETDSKSKVSEEKYLLNLADLNDNKVDIKVSGSRIKIEMATGKNKLIQSFDDGEMQNYSNKVSLLAQNVENAKWLLHTLPPVIKYCQDKEPNDQLAVKGTAFTWIKENLKEIEELQQNLEKVDDSECKWQFVTTKPNKKGDTEEIYEFNIADLNPKSIDFKISGKKLAIQIFTTHNEKNIKYYKNGEPGDYKNNFLIQMDSVEKARQMMAAWKQQMKTCKEE